MKNYEVIEKIKAHHQPYTPDPAKTRDKYLIGDPEEECNGIAVTACATLDVMHKAVEADINLIISHEGITYNYEKGSPVEVVRNHVLQEKLSYAREHHLTVWRDHDHMHGEGRIIPRPKADEIFFGTMKELGWEEYVIGDRLKPLWYKVPRQPARTLAQQLMKTWNLNGLRVVGNIDAEVETVFIAEHVIANRFDQFDIPKMDAAEKADVIIPLEIVDYTLTSYVRDAASLGESKVILEMGHFNAEELGMKYLEKVLPEVLNHEVQVKYIQSGDTFTYLLRE